MVVRLVAAAFLAAAVGLGVAFAPSPVGPAVVAAGAVFGFAVYALRERAAVRGLFAAVDRSTRHQDDVGARLRRELGEDRQAREERDARGQADVERLFEAVKEVAGLHAVATNEILNRMEQGQARLGDQLGLIDKAQTALGEKLGEQLRQLHARALTAAQQDFRQLEALAGLHALFGVRAPLPPSRRWAAAPDLLLYLTALTLDQRPRLIVELGSGLSTIWLAYAMNKSGHGGRIVSLDQDAGYAEKTRALVKAHGLEDLVDVRHAPLVDLELDGEVWPWYDRAALADVDGCSLLVVDGPTGATRSHARYPALPVLAARLEPHATVILDDCIREDERAIASRWGQQYPEWTIETIDHEKITAVFSR